MAKAKKLKSGNYRVLVPDYKDENGKWHYKSFTAPTKKEAEYTAAEFTHNRENRELSYSNRTHYFNLIMPINTDFYFRCVGFRVGFGLSTQTSESVAACDTVIIQTVSPLI